MENKPLVPDPKEEILDVDYHVCRLMLIALNTSATVKAAAEKNRLPIATFYAYATKFNIYYCRNAKSYIKPPAGTPPRALSGRKKRTGIVYGKENRYLANGLKVA